MIGISTAWKSKHINDGNRLLDSMKESNISYLELDYRISEPMRKQMWKRLKSNEFNVLTIHNFFPVIPGIPKQHASADLFRFSATDKNERNDAIKFGIKSLQYAADLEAKAVVFHLGSVEMDDEREKMASFAKGDVNSDTAKEWRAELLAARSVKLIPYLDAVLTSLDRLNEEAIKLGIIIGAENRKYINQIPIFDEYDVIFREFQGGAVRYWHDFGHAESLHRHGFLDHEKDLIGKYAHVLSGVHIHDIINHNDHLAPGMGDLNFARFSKYFKNSTIRILELHEKPTSTDIENGLQLLKDVNII